MTLSHPCFNMKIEVQPPTVIQDKVAMEQPLVVGDAQYDVLHAVLLDPSGQVVAGINEPFASPNDRRASFLNLTVSCPGRYRIRVDAYAVDYTTPDDPVSTHKESVLSREFTVQKLTVDGGNPSKFHHVP